MKPSTGTLFYHSTDRHLRLAAYPQVLHHIRGVDALTSAPSEERANSLLKRNTG